MLTELPHWTRTEGRSRRAGAYIPTIMRTRLIVPVLGLGFALGSLSGCSRAMDLLQSRSDSADAGANVRAATAPGTGAADAPPFTGALTEARVLGAKGLAKPFDNWEQAKAKLEAQLGAPTRVNGKWYEWAVDRDGTCAYVKVEQQIGNVIGAPKDMKTVGMVEGPATLDKNAPQSMRNDCIAMASGKSDPPSSTTLTAGTVVGGAASPKAKGPPAPTRTVSVKEVRDAVAKGQWVGGPVKMKGLAVNTTTMTSGSQRSVSLSIAQAKGDLGSTVGCVLGDVPDPSPKQWAPVEVTGTLESTFGGRIESCKIVR